MAAGMEHVPRLRGPRPAVASGLVPAVPRACPTSAGAEGARTVRGRRQSGTRFRGHEAPGRALGDQPSP